MDNKHTQAQENQNIQKQITKEEQKLQPQDQIVEQQITESEMFLKQFKSKIFNLIEEIKQSETPSNEQIIGLIRMEFALKWLEEAVKENKQKQISELEIQMKAQSQKQISAETIAERIELLNQQDNESNWTDATESQADDQIYMIDDEIINAMQIDSEEEDQKQQVNEDQKQKKQQEQKINIQELEEQFVKGKQSNEHFIFEKHTKFCTAVCGTLDEKYIASGGGDDMLFFYRRSDMEEGKTTKPYFSVEHTETINKIQFSFDSKYAISMTENQIYCTQIDKLKAKRLQIEDPPSDFVCHKQGGVFAAAYGFNVSIFNMKGLSVFQTYYLDQEPSMLLFSESGKQIIAACEEKLRIITPKGGQILKVGGAQFHKSEITSIATIGNVIISGCLEGQLYSSNLNKGTVLLAGQKMKGSINNLCIADNYFLCGPQEDGVSWFDVNKMKKIFYSQIEGSSTDIIPIYDKNSYCISDINGKITLLDKRNPLENIGVAQAGNTIHKLWNKNWLLCAGCEDGPVRAFDLRKIIKK